MRPLFFCLGNSLPIMLFFTSRLYFTLHTSNFETFILGETGILCQCGIFLSPGISFKTSSKTSMSQQTSKSERMKVFIFSSNECGLRAKLDWIHFFWLCLFWGCEIFFYLNLRHAAPNCPINCPNLKSNRPHSYIIIVAPPLTLPKSDFQTIVNWY